MSLRFVIDYVLQLDFSFPLQIVKVVLSVNVGNTLDLNRTKISEFYVSLPLAHCLLLCYDAEQSWQ